MSQKLSLRQRLYIIIFEADTPAGKAFDTALIFAIILSVITVMLESVPSIRAVAAHELYVAEWFFTILFTLEYAARLFAAPSPITYSRSFFGLVDLLSILPTYVSLFFFGAQSLQVVRIFRLVRIFRVYKLVHYVREADILSVALKASRAKITVFLTVVIATVVTMGALMYYIEGATSGFTSIPTGVYWAIVTMTTVGYGDVSPKSPLGQFLASLLMIMGYAIIAVPTGIVSAEIANANRDPISKECPSCKMRGHDWAAKFCKFCGSAL